MKLRRISAFLLALLLVPLLLLPVLAAEPSVETTVPVSHDMHSRLLAALDEQGSESGAYARLKTVIDGLGGTKIALIVLTAAVVILVILVLVIRAVYRRVYRRGGYRKTRGYRSYRGR